MTHVYLNSSNWVELKLECAQVYNYRPQKIEKLVARNKAPPIAGTFWGSPRSYRPGTIMTVSRSKSSIEKSLWFMFIHHWRASVGVLLGSVCTMPARLKHLGTVIIINDHTDYGNQICESLDLYGYSGMPPQTTPFSRERRPFSAGSAQTRKATRRRGFSEHLMVFLPTFLRPNIQLFLPFPFWIDIYSILCMMHSGLLRSRSSEQRTCRFLGSFIGNPGFNSFFDIYLLYRLCSRTSGWASFRSKSETNLLLCHRFYEPNTRKSSGRARKNSFNSKTSKYADPVYVFANFASICTRFLDKLVTIDAFSSDYSK